MTAIVTVGRVTADRVTATATVIAAGCAIATPTARVPERHVDQQHRLTTLESGVRIVTEAMPSVRSVSLGFWIGTGSRYESEGEAGLSHLLEHLLFKGTARYESLQIDQIFDGMGAELNAGTGKETTSVYARVIDEHLADAFDVMADMVFRPTLRDIDSEREVILEEIAMYEDDPQEKVFDMLGEAVFGDDPLGRAIIGRASVISGTPPAEIARFHAARYRPENVVIAASGAIDHDVLVGLARERTAPASPNGVPARPGATAPAGPPGRRFERKDTEQYHVCLGATGLSRHDDRRFALRVLDTIFGGTSSSRLFQEIRERRGLAYSVYSFTSAYADTGQVGLYVGTRAENLVQALSIVGSELARLRSQPATAEELSRAKENLKGRVVLALESTGARMNRLGSEILAGSPLMPLDEVVERIDAVSMDDLAALTDELWDPERLSAAGIGPEAERFDEALAAVAPRLAETAVGGVSGSR
ncbi:MAG TPA: pitrilysin family protein [Solirubrobacteraceae bacterium]|nr:pitrilysin family protein [Solirubrobacteraceae bacterium]